MSVRIGPVERTPGSNPGLVPRMSSAARMARTPARPDEFVGALHDSVHHVRGPSQPARSTKVARGEVTHFPRRDKS